MMFDAKMTFIFFKEYFSVCTKNLHQIEVKTNLLNLIMNFRQALPPAKFIFFIKIRVDKNTELFFYVLAFRDTILWLQLCLIPTFT